ncbi:glycohydrolase toxin TNT-related protein [Microbacterium sp.]|uniref:glycohydrolase toxin TNT-related protein n=1 Tax=Microbacterium sp. TaxID=51671 RepID=UPI003C76343E
MSSVKPIIRELKQAAMKGFAHADLKLHQLTHNIDNHLDDVIRRVKDKDNFDGTPHKPSGPGRPQHGDDRLVPRPECLNEKGDVDWSKAPKNGFVLDSDGNPIMSDHVPDAGDRFDRHGDANGRYVSPITEEGPFSYDSRSLPYKENPNAYHEYEWVHSPADVQSVYDGLDGDARGAVDDVLAKYDMDLSDLAHVSRGDAAPIPDWGTSGGAIQDLLPVSVDLLDKMGMIKEVG